MPLTPVSIDMLVNDVQRRFAAKGKGSTDICLFVGAGISVTAGIKSASGFAARIKQDYRERYRSAADRLRVDELSYAQAMESIPPANQIDVIRDEISAAKLNWAHLGIARLEEAGVFDTIMTTNFDPLLSRACTLMGRYPAVYDLVAIHRFVPSLTSRSGIYHLHGQHDGFALLSTTEALRDHARKIRPVLEAKMRGKIIIVCGYSGANDPLIDEIVRIDPGQHGLYWICHDRNKPASDVCAKLLSRDNCHLIQNQPSDRVFMMLVNRLNLSPPRFLLNPFDYLRSLMEGITPLADEVQTADRNVHVQALAMVDDALAAERKRRPYYQEISEQVSAGRYEEVLAAFVPRLATLEITERAMVVWAAVAMGNRLFNQAKLADEGTAEALFDQADRCYAQAMTLDPAMFEAPFNRAVVLKYRARHGSAERLTMLSLASSYYEWAARARPSAHRILVDWGLCLSLLGKEQQPDEAGATLALAREKFGLAEALGAPKTLIANKLGNCFWFEAQLHSGDRREALRGQAKACYEDSEAGARGSGAYNLACFHAQRRDVAEVVKWLELAWEKSTEEIGRWVDDDGDFDPVRYDPAFVALRKRL